MSERGTDALWALIIGSVLATIFSVCWMLTLGHLEATNTVILLGAPGVLASAFVLGVWSGNPHGGGVGAEVLIIATPVNLLVYSALSYFVLRITSPLRRRRERKQ